MSASCMVPRDHVLDLWCNRPGQWEWKDEDELEQLSGAWSGLVVLRVDVISDLVEIAVRDVGLDALLRALRELVGRLHRPPRERHSHVALRTDRATRGNRSVDRPVKPD